MLNYQGVYLQESTGLIYVNPVVSWSVQARKTAVSHSLTTKIQEIPGISWYIT